MTAPISSQALYGPEANAAEQSRMELQARLNGLGGLNGRQLSPEAKAAKLREACEGFESIFIQKMWQEMRNTVSRSGLLSGREERFWQDMYDQELSKSMTKAGGIGLADMMYEQLSRSLVSASRSTAGVAQGGVFTPQAAPLVRQGGEEPVSTPSLKAEALYEQPGAGAVGPYETPAAPVQEVAQAPQPLQDTQARIVNNVYTAAPNTAHGSVAPEHREADLGQAAGMAQARQAMRDAGDKLGPGAVRPSRSPRPVRRQTNQSASQSVTVAQNPAVAPKPAPGSAEALRAALANAQTGGSAGINEQPLNLGQLVANVQAQNQAANMGTAQAAAVPEQQESPGVVRVRRTTNIPQKSSGKKATRNQSQAIRLLNVDNVGVNSRQGQGLSAYHAQQDMAAQLNEGNAAAARTMPAALAPRSDGGNAAIPPLTAADARI